MKQLLMKKAVLVVALIALSSLTFAQQKSYVFVFLNKKPDAEKLAEGEVEKIMEGHLANMEKMAKEGKLLAAGPFGGGGGMWILSTSSVDEAKELAKSDPGVGANRWNLEFFPYTPRVGGICPVGEKYEMTNYSLVRFTAQVTKFTAATYPQIIKKHDDYLKQLVATGNVVTEGIFGPNEGGIIVMKGEVAKAIFESDPGVQEGLIDLDIKKLFIAKGSFCESKD